MRGGMKALNDELQPIATALRAAIELVIEDARGSRREAEARRIEAAIGQFLAVATHLDQSPAAYTEIGTAGVTGVGDHGLALGEQLTRWLAELGDAPALAQMHRALPCLALWIARRGGELATLEPVVDALSALANASRDTRELAGIARVIGEITAAVAAVIRLDPDPLNPGRPWRILHLNRSIVATRSHDPALMEEAFQALITHLPRDAPAFFREGMRQMQTLDYPPQVRAVMERYQRQFPIPAMH
jgi:hypothetical protein